MHILSRQCCIHHIRMNSIHLVVVSRASTSVYVSSHWSTTECISWVQSSLLQFSSVPEGPIVLLTMLTPFLSIQKAMISPDLSIAE